MKKTILCLTVFLASVILTFSQNTENASTKMVWKVKPLELPANNIELVCNDGREMKVTVLSKTLHKVTIRKADGSTIAMERRHLSTRIHGLIWGVRTKEAEAKYWAEMTPTSPTEKRIKELYRELAPLVIKQDKALAALPAAVAKNRPVWYREFDNSPATEILARLKNPADPIHIKVPVIADSALLKIKNLQIDPEWEKYNLTPWELLSNLEIKTGPEKVSLRPKFKQFDIDLGVHANKRKGIGSELYASYHIIQFMCKSSGIKPPTLEKIKTAHGPPDMWGTYYPYRILDKYEDICCKKPTVARIAIPYDVTPYPDPLRVELAKHELRNGRPVYGDIPVHPLVWVGFQTDDTGETKWECIDSDRINENEGFQHEGQNAITTEFSVRFN